MEAKMQEMLEEKERVVEDTGEKIQLIVFNLAAEEYAVPIEQVKEIVPEPAPLFSLASPALRRRF